MAFTPASVIALVRVQINDVDATRYGDDDALLELVNEAVNLTRINRPDLFIGNWTPAAVGLNDPVPLDDTRRMGLVHFVVGICEIRDDEYAVNGRAGLVAGLSKKYLE